MATYTSTIKASGLGGDYTSLQAWEDDIPATTIAGDIYIAELYDSLGTLTDPTIISDRTTDSSESIIIRAATGNGHGGVVGAGLTLKSTTNYTEALDVDCDYVTVRGFSLEGPTLGAALSLGGSTDSNCLADSLIISGAKGIELNSNSTAVNCLVLGGTVWGFYTTAWKYSKLYNCGAANGGDGIKRETGGTAHIVKNCFAFNNTTDFNVPSATGVDYNASEDSSATGANSITGIVTGDFEDTTTDDYHLSGTSSALYDTGVSLPGIVDTDIDGDTRTRWDIGIDEYVAAGGGTTPISNNTTLQWNLLETISQSNSILWNLLESISNNSELQWNIIQAVNNSSELRWDLLASLSAVSNTSGFYWDIIEAVSSSSDLKWSLLESVNNTSSLHWDLLSALIPVSNTSEFKWSMAGSVSQLLDTQWNLLEQVGVTQELRWTLTEAISQSLESKWDLLQSANNNIQIQWDSISAVDGIVELKWSLLSDTVTLTTTNILILRAKNKNLNLRAKEKTLTLRT